MANSTILPSLCSPQNINPPAIFGTEIINLSASVVSNYSYFVPVDLNYNHGNFDTKGANFCNITVTYTHPGQNDSVSLESWLPLDTWNGRLQAVGGRGWAAGRFVLSDTSMSAAIGEGYVTITTDAGLGKELDPTNWGQFLGRDPEYSYFSGCSQGGRQALMLAQRYPNAYDGIAASAPAINWNQFITSMYWPQLVMNVLGKFPAPCELDHIANAAIAACDGDDGVVDGVVSDIEACKFDPFTLIGTSFNCSAASMQVSEAAAIVSNETWTGPSSTYGTFQWYDMTPATNITGTGGTGEATAVTTCYRNSTCTGKPNTLFTQWMSIFVERYPNVTVSKPTHADFDRIFHSSLNQYSHINTADPDLTQFFQRGGKLIGYHGVNDPLLPIGGPRAYYDAVTALSPDVHDHY